MEERDDTAPAEERDDRDAGEPHDADAEQSDPESSAASAPPPGQEPGEGKSHDV